MTETKAVPRLLRELNERTVLDTVRAGAPISRAEVARRTGISRPTVSLVLRSLLDDGLVRESANGPAGPHYGAVYYEADPEAAVVLGVDFGAGAVRTALCDLAGQIRAREEIRSRGSVEEQIAALAGSVRSLLRNAKLPWDLVANAVVALPAVVSPTDWRVSAPDLPGLGAADLREQFEHALRVPVTLENDVNLAAVAEQRRGVAQDEADFAFLLVGDGLGAAVVLDQELHRGHNGNAGELDAVRSGRLDDVDPCAASLSQFAAEIAGAKQTALAPPFEVQELFAAAEAGDALGVAVVDEAARRVALHVLPLAATLDLPLVVLGGSVGANPALLEPVRRHLEEWLPFPAPLVEVSALGEAAVIEGALAAGVEAAHERVFERRVRQRAS
ncbi:MAG TPA: ROK family transcriptional regulator [Gaiellaceae bacterium]|nr:ROK family transcriptional regulator [Gaiellaceae bacterium]